MSEKIGKGIVKSCTPWADPNTGEVKPSTKGFYTFVLEFDNGFKGRAYDKTSTHPHFIPGKEVEFTAEDKGTYWIFRKPKENKGGYRAGGKQWHTKQPDEIKREYVGFAAGYVKDMVIAGKIPVDEFAKYLGIVQGAINKEVDNIK